MTLESKVACGVGSVHMGDRMKHFQVQLTARVDLWYYVDAESEEDAIDRAAEDMKYVYIAQDENECEYGYTSVDVDILEYDAWDMSITEDGGTTLVPVYEKEE